VKHALALLAALAPAAAQAQWTYSYSDAMYGRGKQTFVVETEGEPGASRFVARALDAGKTLVEFLPPAAPAEGAVPQWPAPSGYPTGYATHLEWTVTIRAAGWETVTVPAGTWRALRIEISGRRGSDPDPFWQVKQAGRFHYVAWFPAGWRRHVRARHQSWTMQDAPFGEEVIELLKAP
jgi:hypothetical protein